MKNLVTFKVTHLYMILVFVVSDLRKKLGELLARVVSKVTNLTVEFNWVWFINRLQAMLNCGKLFQNFT